MDIYMDKTENADVSHDTEIYRYFAYIFHLRNLELGLLALKWATR